MPQQTLTVRVKADRTRVARWALAWAAVHVGASLVAVLREPLEPLAATGLALVTGVLGGATLLAYWRFLQDADELRRKIELDALALAYGVGVVSGTAFQLLSFTGVVDKLALMWVLMLMFGTYLGGVVAGHRRYR